MDIDLDIEGLNRKYGLENDLVFDLHPNGLVRANVQTNQCAGEFFLQGAHVTRYQPASQNHPVLFMSQQALYMPGKALRGGIPICFPWFNSHPSDPSLPAHGWARTSVWNLVQTQKVDGQIEVALGLAKDGFDLIYRISMGETFMVALEVRNAADVPLDYEIALHTYLSLGSIENVSIAGDLENCEHYDQLTQKLHEPEKQRIRFVQETDRIYYGQASRIVLDDPAWQRSIQIDSLGSQATVVWNPWIDKSKRMADFGDLEYLQMCCIETANVRQKSVRLAPGQTHTTTAEFQVQNTVTTNIR
jgi:glucose-6-phosphate 1-epimerase